MVVIEHYLDAKYGGGGPDGSRFDPDPTEVHASQVSDCQRKRFFKHKKGHRSDPSPYFELGRMFELIYGAALAAYHDPDITPDVLAAKHPWEVVERSTRVYQDVSVEIDCGDFDIVGESDWVVVDESAPQPGIQKVAVRDGERTMVTRAGDGIAYNGCVEKVVETKTKGDVTWVERKGHDKKHEYQVYPYIHAMDCDGEIAYMERDNWSEHVVPVEYDPNFWLDVEARAARHAANMSGDEVPAATPMSDGECKFCPFQEECRENGGSQYI